LTIRKFLVEGLDAAVCTMARKMCMTNPEAAVRTNIVIDDKLMEATLKATGLKTKREAVEEGLRTLLRLKQQTELRKLRGKYEWEGDLDAMRRDK
jgi:Arc/MetJ family transcription regulator